MEKVSMSKGKGGTAEAKVTELNNKVKRIISKF